MAFDTFDDGDGLFKFVFKRAADFDRHCEAVALASLDPALIELHTIGVDSRKRFDPANDVLPEGCANVVIFDLMSDIPQRPIGWYNYGRIVTRDEAQTIVDAACARHDLPAGFVSMMSDRYVHSGGALLSPIMDCTYAVFNMAASRREVVWANRAIGPIHPNLRPRMR